MELKGIGLCAMVGVEEAVMVVADLLNGRLGVDCCAGRIDEAGVEESYTELSVEEDCVVGIELFEALEPLGVPLSTSFVAFLRRKSLKKGILVFLSSARCSALVDTVLERIHTEVPNFIVTLSRVTLTEWL